MISVHDFDCFEVCVQILIVLTLNWHDLDVTSFALVLCYSDLFFELITTQTDSKQTHMCLKLIKYSSKLHQDLQLELLKEK